MKQSNKVLWTYGGVRLEDFSYGDEVKQRLFKKIGFEFDTNDYLSIKDPFPLDDPNKHIIKEFKKIVESYGVPRAIIVTDIVGAGSNLIDIGIGNRELERYMEKSTILETFMELARGYDIPFFRISRKELWGKYWSG